MYILVENYRGEEILINFDNVTKINNYDSGGYKSIEFVNGDAIVIITKKVFDRIVCTLDESNILKIVLEN